MAGHGKRRKRGHDDHGEHVDERWLLTYADLITLLMALFMVLFSISSVNKSKFESLQRSLSEAFSGKVLPGGHGIAQQGGSNNIKNPSSQEPFSNLQPYLGGRPEESTKKGGGTSASAPAAAMAESKSFEQLQKRINAVAAEKGLAGKVKAEVTKDGLLIRLMTDDLLFDSGQATPRPDALDLLRRLASLLDGEGKHPLIIEGHTDSQPIHSGRFPTNWELSTARAASVVRTFAADGVSAERMTAAGKAYLNPIAPNTSPAGRSLNRRVEILLPRQAQLPSSSTSPTIPNIAP
jgi:chemotaxis protein MotB